MDDNRCRAQLGERACNVPRSNKRHMRVPEEHADADGAWDDDAPGAIPHPVSREVEHYRRVVADLQAHLIFGCRDDDGQCPACAMQDHPGIPYPCATMTKAGVPTG